MLKWMMIFTGMFAGAAQAQSFLMQADLPTCLSRSQAQCTLLGCDGVKTQFWWACQKLTTGGAAVVVQPSGPFAATTTNANAVNAGLSAGEQSTLQTITQLSTALPYVITTITFDARFTTAQKTAITSSLDPVVTSGWTAIQGAALVNLTAASVQTTVAKIVADGIIPASQVTTIMAQTATP